MEIHGDPIHWRERDYCHARHRPRTVSKRFSSAIVNLLDATYLDEQGIIMSGTQRTDLCHGCLGFLHRDSSVKPS